MEEQRSQSKKRLWVQSSFEDFCVGSTTTESRNASMKRSPKKASLSSAFFRGKHKREDDNSDLWVYKYKPQTKADLAVHNKKIAEVEDWLLRNLKGTGNEDRSRILLVTGPSGAGKTATVYTLAKTVGFELKEWINPLNNNVQHFLEIQNPGIYEEFKRYDSQSTIFWDFMLRANKYSSLPFLNDLSNLQTVVMIEDIPNCFLKNPSDFHQMLRKFCSLNRSAAVFVLNEGNGGVDIRRLFPSDLQLELKVTTISFNPVAQTNLVRALTKVAQAELATPPPTSSLEAIAELSSGDIRMAINTLQFTYKPKGVTEPARHLKTDHAKQQRKGKKKVLTGNEQESIGSRDTSLFIFHALGKVLYCKRSEEFEAQHFLRGHLQHMNRNKLLSNPEDIVTNACLSSESFMLFLHQNFLSFFQNIDDVVRANGYISDADLLSSDWTGRAALEECAALVTVRGLMHSNSLKPTGAWRPLYKPYWFTSYKQVQQRKNSVKMLCQNFRLSTEELVTEVLPYRDLMCYPAKSKEEAALFRELCTFPRKSSRCLDQLSEHDQGDHSDDSESHSSDVSAFGLQPPTAPVSATDSIFDEEFIIEEYDD